MKRGKKWLRAAKIMNKEWEEATIDCLLGEAKSRTKSEIPKEDTNAPYID